MFIMQFISIFFQIAERNAFYSCFRLGMPANYYPHNSEVQNNKPYNLFQNILTPEFCCFGRQGRVGLLIITAYYIFRHLCRFLIIKQLIREEATRKDIPWLYAGRGSEAEVLSSDLQALFHQLCSLNHVPTADICPSRELSETQSL